MKNLPAEPTAVIIIPRICKTKGDHRTFNLNQVRANQKENIDANNGSLQADMTVRETFTLFAGDEATRALGENIVTGAKTSLTGRLTQECWTKPVQFVELRSHLYFLNKHKSSRTLYPTI